MNKSGLTAIALMSAAVVVAAEEPDTSTWVGFSSFSYSGEAVVTPGSGEYANPIIAGFYPDPSICRVGDDYYLVNSAFNYFPSIPIWHSTDLVNWEQIGNVIDRPSQFAIDGQSMSSGTYAPTIRYHEGTFYMINTLVRGIGNFYVTATDPAGPWSEPVRLPSVGGIDPDIFFDDDGKCYILSCDDPVGAPIYSGHRAIKIQQYDLEAKKFVGEKKVLVNGGTDISKQPIWCEGPHLYLIDGTYYLMCAQGGTSTDHTEVIFKSDSLMGPYVPWEENPILSAIGLPNDREDPVTCTGHADLVQTQKGDWYAVFLACQPYEGNYFNTGRQTFLLPVSWEDGWPRILEPKTPVPLTVKKPNLPASKAPEVATTGAIKFTDNFDSEKLDFRWIGIRRPDSQWHSIDPLKKMLFLEPRKEKLSEVANPSYLGTRQQNNTFTCSVTLSAQPKTEDCVAGLAAFQNEAYYYALNVTVKDGKLSEVALEKAAGNILASKKLPENTTSVELKIEGDGPEMKLFYKVGNSGFVQLGDAVESSFISTEVAGGFQGVTLGMFTYEK
ncbi:MAG: glycoside hydrolase family 43 protein [Pontiellaceae bacterium]|nr:glycoside hydrolase family 43 protein [Pontiellaceae bacterium]